MILITGPLFSGKRAFACSMKNCEMDELDRYAVWDVQERVTAEMTAEELEYLARNLAGFEIVITTEVGGGVVPMDAGERARRENAGRLSCLLAERADTVVRVFCGLPMVLKGALPG